MGYSVPRDFQEWMRLQERQIREALEKPSRVSGFPRTTYVSEFAPDPGVTGTPKTASLTIKAVTIDAANYPRRFHCIGQIDSVFSAAGLWGIYLGLDAPGYVPTATPATSIAHGAASMGAGDSWAVQIGGYFNLAAGTSRILRLMCTRASGTVTFSDLYGLTLQANGTEQPI